MRIFILTALVACSSAEESCVDADEEAFMQGHVHRSSELVTTQEGRADSTTNLLEIATHMIKTGVSPDVVAFVDSTVAEIDNDVLPAIVREHNLDQAAINNLLAQFDTAISDLGVATGALDVLDATRVSEIGKHQECRAGEALKCARSRRCQEELQETWRVVRREEERLRELHGYLEHGYCVDPPDNPPYELDPFDWSRTRPYPVLDIPRDVLDFWHQVEIWKVGYMERWTIVQEAWRVHNVKLIECSQLEVIYDSAVEECDTFQADMHSVSCQHSSQIREIRRRFASRWQNLLRDYEVMVARVTQNEYDRKREWETLHIVTCLLSHIHVTVMDSIETGSPCPTEDSDPEAVRVAIEQCHLMSEEVTEHLTIIYGTPPPVPPLPPVIKPPCSPEYMVSAQWSFSAEMQTEYTASLESEHLMDYFTTLSAAGWPGCAAPHVCVDCEGMQVTHPDENRNESSHVCDIHETYLLPGQSDMDTFRCLDGGCLSMAGRCNGVTQCNDGSDENGCNSPAPAFLGVSGECPSGLGLAFGESNDVNFRCHDGSCTERAALCNGHNNCADGSDESHCGGQISVSVEATSGRTICVETMPGHHAHVTGTSPSLLQVSSTSEDSTLPDDTKVFHDRDYKFDTYGDFGGETWIKYSNDDKETPDTHVMTKITTTEPLVVVIVKLVDKTLPWLESMGWVPVEKTGLTYSGDQKENGQTEWSGTLSWNTFNLEDIWGKYFDAGVVSIPGNDGGDGSFLIFLERP